jgi:hypothetical protein
VTSDDPVSGLIARRAERADLPRLLELLLVVQLDSRVMCRAPRRAVDALDNAE